MNYDCSINFTQPHDSPKAESHLLPDPNSRKPDWSFDVNPYLSAVGFDTETTLPALPPRTPAGVDRFETGITGTAMHGKN